MKPHGPIPDGYSTDGGELVIAGHKVTDLVARPGRTPLFVYDRALISARIAALRSAMPDSLGINYAIKANPFAPLLVAITGMVDGFDIASGGELGMALAAGMPADKISFAGPGKREDELAAAIAAGVTINLELEGEAERALAIGQRTGATPRLAIRVNPGFELRGSGMKMGGGAKPFGIDEARVPALMRQLIGGPCEFRGLHIYAGSQALDARAVIEAQENTLSLADRLAEEVAVDLPALNIGGGFGVPYFAKDEPLDIISIGAALKERLARRSEHLLHTDVHCELGRYLVAEAGVYLTRVLERKVSHDTTFLITDGGLHHQLAASGNFGTVVRRNYPVAIATPRDAAMLEEVNVVGCLCTPLDRLADQVQLPRADVGDLVAVFMAGAYGATASPAQFLGQGAAVEMLV